MVGGTEVAGTAPPLAVKRVVMGEGGAPIISAPKESLECERARAVIARVIMGDVGASVGGGGLCGGGLLGGEVGNSLGSCGKIVS
jgi:hypothetical protein